MPRFIRHPKDFWTGVIYLFFGIAAIVVARDYPMGTAGRMGPAYFPTVLGGLLALIGAAALVRSFLRDGEKIGAFAVRNLVIVLGAVVLFGVLIRGAGLAPAIIVLTFVSSLASAKFHWRSAALLCAALTLFCYLVFVKLLRLPIPMIGPWFGA